MRYAVEIVATSDTHEVYVEQEISAYGPDVAEHLSLEMFHHGCSTDGLLNWDDIDIISIKEV